MADLAASDITTVINSSRIVGKRRVVTGTIAFGDGSKTTPVTGVPLPALSVFWFKRQMDSFEVYGVNEKSTDYMVKFGPANRTLLMYVSHDTAGATTAPLDTDATEAPAARIYSFIATGW